MNYLLKSKPKHENRLRNISIISVFVILSGLAFIFPNGMRSIFSTIAVPIWKTRDYITTGFSNSFNFFSSKSSLIEQVNSLKEEVSSLNLKVIDYESLIKENEELKSMMGREMFSERILARILSKPPRSPYDTLVIDIGSADGVNQGSKVYLSDNVIIGIITSVTPHTSLVELFSKGDKNQEAVLERTGATYNLIGRGGANFSIQVPKETDVEWGDVFVYPGLSSSIISSVFYIDTNSQNSFKTIFLRIPGNVFQAKWVFVEKPLTY